MKFARKFIQNKAESAEHSDHNHMNISCGVLGFELKRGVDIELRNTELSEVCAETEKTSKGIFH